MQSGGKKIIIFLFSVPEDQTASDHFKISIFLIHLEKISKVTLAAWNSVNRTAMTGKLKEGSKYCHSSLFHIRQLN